VDITDTNAGLIRSTRGSWRW